MKNILMDLRKEITVFLIPVILLTACNFGNKKPGNKQQGVNAAHTDSGPAKKAVDIPALSTEAYVSAIVSKRQAIAAQLPGINAETAAKLYRSLALYVDTALAGISGNEAKWLDEYVNYYSEAKKAVVPPAKVQQRIQLLATAGIEPWGIGEGYTELRIEPSFYTHLFKTSLPADYSMFLQLQADEDTVLYSADAGLIVSFNLIGKRALNWEKFLDTHPNSIFVAEARELHERYCYDYLFGEDNTPSFDHRDDLGSLYPENKAEYLSFIQQHGDTKTGRLVKQFLDKLSTAKTYDDLWRYMRTAIGTAYSGELSLLPVQTDFLAGNIESLTKKVYDTVSTEIGIGGGAAEKIERNLDSILYFQQDNNTYCVAIFTNRGKSGGAPFSGWVDVWAFKKTDGHWQTAAYLLNAGGGGMYGNSGSFDKLIRIGTHTTGIVVSGGITHMGSSVSWDDMIAFQEEKLFPVMNIVTQNAYDAGNGIQKCSNNKWVLQHSGQQENYDLVIFPGSCMGGNTPLDRIMVPYKKGRYNIPAEFQDKGI
ncbi:hypothetical protein [Chitinophaga sp. HK235]|uniref:hypothetical protein n=1 Tax=Chitinophaga sp. HK235 TaxID=2952571 RepID=UPI001BA5A1FE|nr:hypothetical protein [Chitinophaga sp. HK235]